MTDTAADVHATRSPAGLSLTPGEALAALFLANADKSANAANDVLVEELLRRRRGFRRSSTPADRAAPLRRAEATPVAGRHRLKGHQVITKRRGVEMVDIRTLVAHVLSDAAAVAGRRGGGHYIYIALCGAEGIPASLTAAPEGGYCLSCTAIPTQRMTW